MTIDLSPLISEDAFDYSASRAELGDNAGQITWKNAKQAPVCLKTPEELEAFRDWVADFGAWSAEEIAAWNATECNALFVQFVAGDIREAGADSLEELDEEELREGQEHGRFQSYLFKNNGEWFYELSR